MKQVGPDSPAVLVLGLAEWSAPIATNQHYVARELARDFDVTFAEGTGTRGPRLTVRDLGRIWRRLRGPTGEATRPLPSRVDLLPLRLLPHAWRPITVNSRLLRHQTRQWAASSGPKVLWSYTPYTYGLEGVADVTVYHLVDMVHENEGVDVAGYLAAESDLADRTDVAVATSPVIAHHLTGSGFDRVVTLANVADTEVFVRAAGTAVARRHEVIFAGALSAQKLDERLLLSLAAALPSSVSLTLVGPVGSQVADRAMVRRLSAQGAVVLCTQTPQQLAQRMAGASVGVVPYRLTPLTGGISPLKVYEYLACGLPVVTTALPSMRAKPGAIWVEPDADSFVAQVLALLRDLPSAVLVEARQSLARRNDWSARGQLFRELVSQENIGRVAAEDSRDVATYSSVAALRSRARTWFLDNGLPVPDPVVLNPPSQLDTTATGIR